MSDQNVDAVRRIYEGWRVGDFRVGVELLDEHVELVMRPEFPDAGTYHGPEGVREYMRGFLEPWTRITIEADELIGAGDCVVVAVHQRGVGRGSGAATGFRYFHVWTFRAGKVIRLEMFRDRAGALAAAGGEGP
jgi:uncharacterized protein